MSANAFSVALRDGLADVAYAFDGAFRQPGSLSRAERAAYGLRPTVVAVASHAAAARPPRLFLAGHVQTPFTGEPMDAAHARGAAQVLSDVDETTPVPHNRCERDDGARRRRAAAVLGGADDTRRTFRWLSVRARIDGDVVHIIVSGARRFFRVFEWTR